MGGKPVPGARCMRVSAMSRNSGRSLSSSRRTACRVGARQIEHFNVPVHRQDHRRRRRAVGVLQVSGRALDSSAHHQPDRVELRHRAVGTKGPGARAAGIAMAYKLIDAAQTRWRAVNAPHLVALVRAGAVFHKGKLL
jgi:hypothetical protein